jgi:hypothetical protein
LRDNLRYVGAFNPFNAASPAGTIKREGGNVKNQTTSGTTPVLPTAQPSSNGAIDTATLELLASWRLEDSKATPDQIRKAEEELREFKQAMNENRTTAGEVILYP